MEWIRILQLALVGEMMSPLAFQSKEEVVVLFFSLKLVTSQASLDSCLATGNKSIIARVLMAWCGGRWIEDADAIASWNHESKYYFHRFKALVFSSTLRATPTVVGIWFSQQSIRFVGSWLGRDSMLIPTKLLSLTTLIRSLFLLRDLYLSGMCFGVAPRMEFKKTCV